MRSAGPESMMDMLPAVTPSSGPSGPAGSISMAARSTPSSSAAICASAVTMPWPSSTLPTRTPIVPSGRTSIQRERVGLAARFFGSSANGLTGASGPAPTDRSPRADDRPDHALLGAAAAQVAVERLGDHRLRRVWLAVEQRGGTHDD